MVASESALMCSPGALALLLLLACGGPAWAQGSSPAPASSAVTIASQVPLRIAVTRRTKLKLGAAVAGSLLEPLYVGTQMVLPARTIVTGKVVDAPPVDRATRTAALMDGDFTPLHVPVVDFDSVRLSSGAVLQMNTVAHVRQGELIRFVPKPKQSIFQKIKSMARDRIKADREEVTAPHKSDRLLRLLYQQLPYHPQRIWANTQFDAELQAPLDVPGVSAQPVAAAPADALLREQPIVRVRLTEGVSSESAHSGDAVHAALTAPVYDHERRLIFPEGAALTGVVLKATPSRRLGHNGTLRFAFRSMQPLSGEAQTLQGQVKGAEGESTANVTVDEEGGVHANPDRNRFVAPLLLAVLAAGGHDDDGGAGRQGLASNGFGIVVRLVGFTSGSRNFATGVGAYGLAKSVYRHFLAHGRPVTFARDTAIEVQLSSRR